MFIRAFPALFGPFDSGSHSIRRSCVRCLRRRFSCYGSEYGSNRSSTIKRLYSIILISYCLTLSLFLKDCSDLIRGLYLLFLKLRSRRQSFQNCRQFPAIYFQAQIATSLIGFRNASGSIYRFVRIGSKSIYSSSAGRDLYCASTTR